MTLTAESSTVAPGGSIEARTEEGILQVAGKVDASAQSTGQGGSVVLWGVKGLSVTGSVAARGGDQGGNGGFIETSTLGWLDVRAVPDASAPQGQPGTWLVDPYDITIVSGATSSNINGSTPFVATGSGAQLSADTIVSALNSGTSVSISTGDAANGSDNGDITVAAPINATIATGNNPTLTLSAWRNIAIQSTISGSGNALNVTLNANQGNVGGSISSTANYALSLVGGTLNFNTDFTLLNSGLSSVYSVATGIGNKMIASGSNNFVNVRANHDVDIPSASTLRLNGSSSTPYVSGVISGAGSLLKTGTGTYTLYGDNTYSGATTISAGTLQLGNGGTSGSVASTSVVNDASLVVNRSNALTIASTISGTGSLTQQGSGTLTLTGSNTFTGGTYVNGVISGAGSLVKSGTGTYTLTGNNT
jgi:autotransporter-associated beta strand protein